MFFLTRGNVLVLGGCLGLFLVGFGDGQAATEQDVTALIRQLGNESYEVREAATQRLMKMPEAARALRRAQKSADAEVARRASDIIIVLDRAQEKAALAKITQLSKSGDVDQLVEQLVSRCKWEDELASWQVVAELADQIRQREQEFFGSSVMLVIDKLPVRDYRRYATSLRPEIVVERRPHVDKKRCVVVRGEDIIVTSDVARSLLVSSRSTTAGGMYSSIIFAGGSIELSHIANSIIICDGDFTAHRGAANCLILAHGDVRCGTASGCRIFTDGRVQCEDKASLSSASIKTLQAFRFVKFFDPADVGIKVESAKGGVRVKEAEKGKRFAAAGIQADDVILSIEGELATDAETFRRRLRKELAIGGEFTLKVRRGDKERQVRIPEKS